MDDRGVVSVQRSYDGGAAKLYLCSTPIGNLEDATFRLVDTLRQADVIAAEDTRHTRKLLSHFDIHPDLLVSYHQHNMMQRAEDLVRWWDEGKSIALVTDAGTPGISDPGEHAALLATQHGVAVIPVPGANAVLSALIASGLPCQPFVFIGFWPRDKKTTTATVEWLNDLSCTVVMYESPHRVVKTLTRLAEIWPNRKCTIARELTKRHETFVRGTLSDVAEHVASEPVRGEFVLVLGPAVAAQVGAHGQSGDDDAEGAAGEDGLEAAIGRVAHRMEEGIPHAEAVRMTASEMGIRRKALYQATLNRT